MSFFDGIQGDAEHAFVKTFAVIPDNTTAIADIKLAVIAEQNDEKFYELTWRIIDGDFKGQQIRQKIKCWDGDSYKAKRAKSMLLLIMTMFHVKHSGEGAPNELEILPLIGKIAGIKIGYMASPKSDGTLGEYNFVREVHKAEGFECSVGESPRVESAFSRNPKTQKPLEGDIPF